MSWFTNTLSSSIGRKMVMSLTGLFLIVFLIEHLIGNIMLLTDPTGLDFNEFAHFMKHNKLIIVGEFVLFGGFLFHIIDGIMLVRKNRNARPVRYAHKGTSRTTSWASKFMGPFGIAIMLFLILHLYNFFRYKYFAPLENMPGTDIGDMAKKVYLAFSNPVEVIIYVVAMAIIGFHLFHGFQSAFQTLGLNHKKYTPVIKKLGVAYSIIVPIGYAIIPVIIYIRSLS